jgi:nucleotidyltransferase/DNA polymerase involved in DNA repair
VFSSNYALYADLSSRVMQTLTDLSPAIEIYSIDEAFVNVSGIDSCMPLDIFGHQMRNQVLKNTGLTVGVGIAQTKTLAKLANYAAKKWRSTALLICQTAIVSANCWAQCRWKRYGGWAADHQKAKCDGHYHGA